MTRKMQTRGISIGPSSERKLWARYWLAGLVGATVLLGFAGGCGEDDDGDGGGTQADRYGVGAQCAVDDDCNDPLLQPDGGQLVLHCLLQFKGGYCGIADCQSHDDCPSGAACAIYDLDQRNYCFRLCADKPECNRHRDAENESNCSGSITFVGTPPSDNAKLCKPPSGG